MRPAIITVLSMLMAGCPKDEPLNANYSALERRLERKYPGPYSLRDREYMDKKGLPPSLAKHVYREYFAGEEDANCLNYYPFSPTADDIMRFHSNTQWDSTRRAIRSLDACVQDIASIQNSRREQVYSEIGAAKFCMNGRTPDEARQYAHVFEGMQTKSDSLAPGLAAGYFALRFAEEQIPPEKAERLSYIFAHSKPPMYRGGRYYEDLRDVLPFAERIPTDMLMVLTDEKALGAFPLSISDTERVTTDVRGEKFVKYVADLIDLFVCRDTAGYLKVENAITLWDTNTAIEDIENALDIGVRVCDHIPPSFMSLVNEQNINPLLVSMLLDYHVSFGPKGIYLPRFLPAFQGAEGITKMEQALREFERGGIPAEQGLHRLLELDDSEKIPAKTRPKKLHVEHTVVHNKSNLPLIEATFEELRQVQSTADLENIVSQFPISVVETPFSPVFEYRIDISPDNPVVMHHYRALENVSDSMKQIVFGMQKGNIVFVTGPVTDQPELASIKGNQAKYGWSYDDAAGVYSAIHKKAFFRVDIQHNNNSGLHEFGHMVDDLIGFAIYNYYIHNQKIWKNVAKECSGTSYVNDNGEEEFAEGFAMFYGDEVQRQQLKHRCPEVSRYFQLLEQMAALYVQECDQ